MVAGYIAPLTSWCLGPLIPQIVHCLLPASLQALAFTYTFRFLTQAAMNLKTDRGAALSFVVPGTLP